MNNDILIRAEAVSKKFCRSLKKSLWYGMQDLGNELCGRSHGGKGRLRPDEFWAVKDVSFELRRGECLGLIGRNGAGKTTLLRMLNGLIKPDQGKIEMRGRVGALIALGAGFNPVLTGRENIYANASVLGLPKKEIDVKLQEIVDFAEIGDFIDVPVQSYSSGMQVRLGFAVASSLHTDVLLLDEVLAVGDRSFRNKCYRRIQEKRSKCGIIFVSHNIHDIQRVSDRGILLEKGVPRKIGPVETCLDIYLSSPETLQRNSGMGFELQKISDVDYVFFLPPIAAIVEPEQLMRFSLEARTRQLAIIISLRAEAGGIVQYIFDSTLKELLDRENDGVGLDFSISNLSTGGYAISLEIRLVPGVAPLFSMENIFYISVISHFPYTGTFLINRSLPGSVKNP